MPPRMRKGDLLRRKVEDIELRPGMSVDALLTAYDDGASEMEDAELLRIGIHRLGNVLVPRDSYGPLLEKRVQPILRELWDSGVRAVSTRDLLWEFGKRVKDPRSLLYWAARNEI